MEGESENIRRADDPDNRLIKAEPAPSTPPGVVHPHGCQSRTLAYCATLGLVPLIAVGDVTFVEHFIK